MVGKWCRRCSLLRCSGPFSAASIPSSMNPSAHESPSLATQCHVAVTCWLGFARMRSDMHEQWPVHSSYLLDDDYCLEPRRQLLPRASTTTTSSMTTNDRFDDDRLLDDDQRPLR
ncbi:hypothetical protein BDZ89DRAFT_682875 [Hymenopellis radicata]|nr:hypothetical protein BDZ89DRAFT_682875 [Hymenopellis radicata]